MAQNNRIITVNFYFSFSWLLPFCSSAVYTAFYWLCIRDFLRWTQNIRLQSIGTTGSPPRSWDKALMKCLAQVTTDPLNPELL